MTYKMLVLVHLLMLLTCVSMTSSEIFTSSLKVERMVMEEEALLKELKNFIHSQYNRLKMFSLFYSDRLQEVHFRYAPSVKQSLKHPNGVYHAIKRFASDYRNVLGEYYENFHRTVNSSSGQFLADFNDIRGARSSLLRLQSVYKMETMNMILGDYLGYKGPPLDIVDAFEIGQTAFSEGKLNLSIEWLNASLRMLNAENKTQMIMYRPSIGSVKALLGRVHLYRGDVHEAEKLYEEAKLLDPYCGDVIELAKELKNHPKVNLPPLPDYFQNFSSLCSLENNIYPSDPTNPKLVCRYREALLPYYRFNEELLSISPFASVIYDVISDKENEHLKSFVHNKLERGKIGGSQESVVSDIRTSDLAWIWDTESEMAPHLSMKIKHITGLETFQNLPDGPVSSEAFQVVNYGLGGHYEVHMDPFDKPPEQIELRDSGERIATFLIYLSDVQRGGSTVFTRAGIAVAPKKNMALMWFNYDTAHREDSLTHHAGCPVLIGQKWICNKWIWTYGNTFRRRCGLTPDATQLDIEKDMKRGYK